MKSVQWTPCTKNHDPIKTEDFQGKVELDPYLVGLKIKNLSLAISFTDLQQTSRKNLHIYI